MAMADKLILMYIPNDETQQNPFCSSSNSCSVVFDSSYKLQNTNK